MEIVDSLGGSGIVLTSEVAFNKSLIAPLIDKGQLATLLGTLEAKNIPRSLVDLSRLSVKLCEAAFILPRESILRAGGGENPEPENDWEVAEDDA